MDLKTLQKKWYKKLKDSGFEDIEDTREPYRNLHRWDSHYFSRRFTPDTFNAKKEYFEIAQNIMLDFKFEDKRQKDIMKLHSEGFSTREIASKIGIGSTTVQRVIKDVRKKYKENFYENEDS